MEDKKNENKVIMTINQYDELKRKEFLLESIKDYLLSYAELEDGKMKLDYSLRYSNILNCIVKKNFPISFNKKLEELKQEKEEE